MNLPDDQAVALPKRKYLTYTSGECTLRIDGRQSRHTHKGDTMTNATKITTHTPEPWGHEFACGCREAIDDGENRNMASPCPKHGEPVVCVGYFTPEEVAEDLLGALRIIRAMTKDGGSVEALPIFAEAREAIEKAEGGTMSNATKTRERTVYVCYILCEDGRRRAFRTMDTLEEAAEYIAENDQVEWEIDQKTTTTRVERVW